VSCLQQIARPLRASGAFRLCAALSLLAAVAPAAVGQAFVPTSDDRFIHVSFALPSATLTPVPFQPFDETLYFLEYGYPVAGAWQISSLPADGIVGQGGAGAYASSWPGLVQSVLDVSFELADPSVFSLQGSLVPEDPPASCTFVLERLAPNPEVLISGSGDAAFDELLPMTAGTYRLRADAEISMTSSGGATFDVDFRLVCSSPDPLDSDGDGFVDGCDVCPLVFDPDQTDTDGDGIGDACGGLDGDGDGYADALDNCPADPNPDQLDSDFDGRGDVCDDPEVITQILDAEGWTLYNPMRVALAADGTVYVVATSSSNLFQISPAGAVAELFSGGPLGANVADVAVAPDGFVYTAGGSSAKCYKIDPETGAATLFLGPDGDGQDALLQFANRVVVAGDGRAFVSGRDSQNVFEVATDGTVVEVLDSAGTGTTPLSTPTALDVDAAGNLYVLGDDGSTPRVFRIAPDHQVEVVVGRYVLPVGIQGFDLALGPDGSIYVGGNGVAVRRPSGQIDILLPDSDPRFAYALDVDVRGVVHVVQEYFGPPEAFRITPSGQIGGLMDSSGDGLGHPLTAASDVAVADGYHKRIAIVGRQSRNAFLVTDARPVPLLGPVPLALLAIAMAAIPAISRRRLH